MDVSLIDQISGRLVDLQGIAAYATIFAILLACGLGLPIPEDITLFTAGYLAYLNNIELGAAILTCFVGVLAGDFILFSLGRLLGRKILKIPILRYSLTPERLALAEEKLKKNAKKVCFTARFLAGLRAPIYLTAGVLGVKPRIFVMMDGLAALLSVPALVLVGWYFGDEIEIGLAYMRRAEKYIVIFLVIAGLIFVFKTLRDRLRASPR